MGGKDAAIDCIRNPTTAIGGAAPNKPCFRHKARRSIRPPAPPPAAGRPSRWTGAPAPRRRCSAPRIPAHEGRPWTSSDLAGVFPRSAPAAPEASARRRWPRRPRSRGPKNTPTSSLSSIMGQICWWERDGLNPVGLIRWREIDGLNSLMKRYWAKFIRGPDFIYRPNSLMGSKLTDQILLRAEFVTGNWWAK